MPYTFSRQDYSIFKVQTNYTDFFEVRIFLAKNLQSFARIKRAKLYQRLKASQTTRHRRERRSLRIHYE